MRSLVLAFVLTGAACSDNTGGAIDNACTGDFDNLLGGLCDLLSRCPNVYPLAYSDRDQCKAILCWATTCRFDSVRVGDERVFTIKQTIPTINTSGQQACLDWLSTISCDQANLSFSFSGSSSGSSSANPCSDVFGSNDNDSSRSSECSSDSCAAGTFCKYGSVDVDAGVRTCSTCLPMAKLGESCIAKPCVKGLWCDGHFQTSPFVCKEPQAAGAPCLENSRDNSPCQSGFCNFRTQMCDDFGKEGDPCTQRADCREGRCNAQMKCEHLHVNGEDCASDIECAIGKCDLATLKCGWSDGVPCSPFSNNYCRGFCDSRTNLCKSAQPLGSSCQNDSECESKYCAYSSFGSSSRSCATRCDDEHPCATGEICGSFSTCEQPRMNGSQCDRDEQCVSGLCNSDEVCAEKPRIGGPCSGAGSCLPIGFCENGTCQKLKEPGEACSGFDSCKAPFVCLNSTCVRFNLTCTPAPAGQQCAFFRVCDDKSYCDLAGGFTCKERVGAGQMCSSAEQCIKDLYCNNNLCVTRLGAGSPCTTGSQCASGTYCVRNASSQMSCTPGPAGQPCDQYDGPFCPDGYYCDNRACVAGTATAGQNCSSSGPGCAAGLSCQSGNCMAPQPIGGRCSDDDGCLSGHCDQQSDVCLNSAQCVLP